ncbi:TATA-box-binding protein [Halobacteria archaeon AArc-dxtr1]|nr:TATA-box-binding protein [Halobacteria archaeon AArc-dxtr1]
MVQIVNVVASGSLNVELDLKAIATELDDVVDYDPDKYPGAYFRLDDVTSLITLYRTGKYIITGADSEDDASVIRARFLELLAETGILDTPDDDWFSLQNFVCTADLDRSLNLNALAIGLGLERTEYEPEQFPGLIFRPPDAPCVVLLFASGKIVLTGCPDLETAETTFKNVKSQIRSLFPSE